MKTISQLEIKIPTSYRNQYREKGVGSVIGQSVTSTEKNVFTNVLGITLLEANLSSKLILQL